MRVPCVIWCVISVSFTYCECIFQSCRPRWIFLQTVQNSPISLCITRSRSSSHICGGTTGGGLPFRSSPVSSCCGSQGRSSPEAMEQEIYGGNFSNSAIPTTNTTTSTSASVRNGAVPSLYGPISPGQTPGSHSLFLSLLHMYSIYLTILFSRSISLYCNTPLCTHRFNLDTTLSYAISVPPTSSRSLRTFKLSGISTLQSI